MNSHSPETPNPIVTRRTAIVSAGMLTGASIPLLRMTSAQTAGVTSVAGQSTTTLADAARSDSPLSVGDYEKLAKERMSHAAWEYITSGCADDVTAQWNCEALARLRLNPRVMVDVSKVSTTIKLLGRELPHPILLAPTALHLLVHPEAELETARGAGTAKSIMVASTGSNRTIGEICQAATEPVWFQLYVQNDRAITKDLIERAAGAGCQALCVTVDQPVLYNRDRVLRLGPFAADLPMGNYRRTGGSSFAASAPTRSREITWRDLEWFKSLSKLPVFLKGIIHPDDAEIAVKGGVDGIIASNHGGRALDSCPATIDALPRIVDRIGGRIPILMDGGIRRGTDVLKAIGLGATAVLIGRPYLFGLAVNGAEGVRHVVEILRAELEAAMALTGCTSIPAVDRSVIYAGP